MAVALRFPALVAFAMVYAAFAGCVVPDDVGGDDESGEGNVAFYVKDAPSDELSGVFVTFVKVEVHRAGSGEHEDDDEDDDEEDEDDENETDDDEDDDNETSPPGNNTGNDTGNQTGNQTGNGTGNNTGNQTGNQTGNETGNMTTQSVHDSRAGWYVVFEGNETVDLKNFTGDARAFLGNATVPDGKYTKIFIWISDAWGTLAENGTRVDIKVPSDRLQIVRTWTVEDGETTELTVDFELDKSVKKAGRSGMWILQPVMKLSVDHVEAGEDDEDENDDDRGRGRGGHDDDGEDGDDDNETADDNETEDDGNAGSGSANSGHGGGNSASNGGQGKGDDD